MSFLYAATLAASLMLFAGVFGLVAYRTCGRRQFLLKEWVWTVTPIAVMGFVAGLFRILN